MLFSKRWGRGGEGEGKGKGREGEGEGETFGHSCRTFGKGEGGTGNHHSVTPAGPSASVPVDETIRYGLNKGH